MVCIISNQRWAVLPMIACVIAGVTCKANAMRGINCSSANFAVTSYIVSLSAGAAWVQTGQQQTIVLQPAVKKTFTVSNKTQTVAAGELFVGIEHLIAPSMAGQLGLAIGGMDTIEPQGNVWEGGDPQLNDVSYQYKVRSLRGLVKGKLIWDANSVFNPYVFVGLGLGYNTASSWRLTASGGEVVSFPLFANASTTSFAYSFGAGIQTVVSPNLRFGVGYEFADVGQTQLDRAPEQTINSGVRNHKIQSNALQCTVSFVI